MAFVYPLAREIRAIEQERVTRSREGRLGFEIMPVETANAFLIQWTQMDNFAGLQHLRGLDGSPTSVPKVGRNLLSYTPGVYGEFDVIGETELMTRAGGVLGNDVPIDVSDLVMGSLAYLDGRENDRAEATIWTLLTTGAISVPLPGDAGIGFKDTFPIQTYTGSDWSDATNGAPRTDLRAVQQLATGTSANFGAGAMAIMNRVTANRLLSNKNSNDLGGQFSRASAAPIQGVPFVNQILAGEDLPTIRIYDEGYQLTDGGEFTKFIPDDKVVVIGQRNSGARLGAYRMVRNINNPGYAAGSYSHIIDTTGRVDENLRRVPPKIEIHRGHNGGPVIYFPGSVVVMSV